MSLLLDNDMSEPRLVFTSVTNFLYYGDEYLLMHRSPHKTVDANRLNGIGGRLEAGEDFLTAAIRETEEETGYVVTPQQIQLAGITKLEGGYSEDWIFCTFRIKVPTKKIPLGSSTREGELLWLHKDQVLTSSYELVDDLKFSFPEIVKNDGIFFLHEFVGPDEKIASYTITHLPANATLQ